MADTAEPDRIAGRIIVRIGLVIFGVLIASLLLLAWLAHYYTLRHTGPAPAYPVPPPPQIAPDAQQELQRYLGEQGDRISGYGWADRANGWARIPIDRAMQLYASPNQGGTP